jgi:2-hydroxychromene-2-carboxylate isomerase
MPLPFYFDYACPFAYLASCRVEPFFGEIGAEIDFRPVQLATLKEPTAGQAPPPGPRKAKWFDGDLAGWSEMVGADLDTSPRHLIGRSTRLALKAALVAKDEGRFRDYHYPTYRARWAEARDLSEREVVRELLAGAGLDAEAALRRAESPELESRIERDTQRAIEQGVFGVPTLFTNDRMFWGNDRFELARFYIQENS